VPNFLSHITKEDLAEAVTTLTFIAHVSNSNLGWVTDYSDGGFSRFSSPLGMRASQIRPSLLYLFHYGFFSLLRMTDTMSSQITDISSWDTLYNEDFTLSATVFT
jgi:hypothetical protein